MREYLTLGSSPAGEDCAQVGASDYHERSRRELKALIAQLRRVFGDEPLGASLSIKTFPHDFGSYSEVVCYFEDSMEEAVNYAYLCENLPEEWDDEALEELRGANLGNHLYQK